MFVRHCGELFKTVSDGFVMNEYIDFWKNGFNFSGRCRRRDYWVFTLVNIIVMCVMAVVPPVLFIYGCLTVIPLLALIVRRLHDVGYSGGWVGLLVVSGGMLATDAVIIGLLFTAISAFVLFVFTFLDSEKGTNRYGADPKARDRARVKRRQARAQRSKTSERNPIDLARY